MNNLSTRTRALLALSTMLTTLIVGVAVKAAGDGPPTRAIPYRGQLELNGRAVSGLYALTFRLWDDPVADGAVNLLHEETLVDVPVAGGAFSVLLGDTVALDDAVFTSAELFLSVSVGGTHLAGRQQIFAGPRVVDPPGEFSTGHLIVDATDSTGGPNGWRIAADLVGPTAAIRHEQGGLLLGFHSDENFYLGTFANPSSFNYSMIVTPDPNAPADAYGHGELRVGGLNLGPGSTGVGQIQFGRAGNCDGGASLANPASVAFAQPFATEPTVVVTINEEDQAGCTEVRLEGVTTTGFTIRSWALGAVSACGCIEYIAVAP